MYDAVTVFGAIESMSDGTIEVAILANSGRRKPVQIGATHGVFPFVLVVVFGVGAIANFGNMFSFVGINEGCANKLSHLRHFPNQPEPRFQIIEEHVVKAFGCCIPGMLRIHGMWIGVIAWQFRRQIEAGKFCFKIPRIVAVEALFRRVDLLVELLLAEG